METFGTENCAGGRKRGMVRKWLQRRDASRMIYAVLELIYPVTRFGYFVKKGSTSSRHLINRPKKRARLSIVKK
jgi:hypothetical protein